jgi:hypothetical protein
MRIERRYTVASQDPYKNIDWRTATSEIKNPDGTVVFRMEGIEVPTTWSQVAVDVLAQKYFRKAGVPSSTMTRPGHNDAALAASAPYATTKLGAETSASGIDASPAAGPIGAGRMTTSVRT